MKYRSNLPVVRFRLSDEERELLRKIWQQRHRPDPSDFRKKVLFRSEQDYIEFVVRASLRAAPSSWYLFSHMMNPDFPQE